jgi:hypothetical protein
MKAEDLLKPHIAWTELASGTGAGAASGAPNWKAGLGRAWTMGLGAIRNWPETTNEAESDLFSSFF